MADKKARIEVGLDGVGDVVEGFKKITGEATFLGVGLTTAVLTVKKLSDELNKLKGIKPDVSLSETVNKSLEYRDLVDLISRRSGSQLNINNINKSLNRTSLNTGLEPKAIGESALQMGGATGKYQEALDASEIVAKHAQNRGIDLKEATENATSFVNILKVAEKDLGKFYSQISDNASNTGTSPLTYERQLAKNAASFKGLSFKTDADRQYALELQNQFNKSANPERAGEQMSQAIGVIKSSQEDIQKSAALGGKKFNLYDQSGNVNLPALGEISDYIERKAGGNRQMMERIWYSVTNDMNTSKTLIDTNFKALKGVTKQYSEEPFTAGSSPTVQAQIAEQAKRDYDTRIGGLGMFSESGENEAAKAARKEQEARNYVISMIKDPEQRARFVQGQNVDNGILSGAVNRYLSGFGAAEGSLEGMDIPLKTTSEDVVAAEKKALEAKDAGDMSTFAAEQSRTNELLEKYLQQMTPVRAPSTGQQ